MGNQSNSKHSDDKEFIPEVCGFLQERRKYFQEILKQQIAIANYTQTRLGDELHVDNSTVSNWISGKRIPDPEIVYACCIVLKLNERRKKMLIGAYLSSKTADDVLRIINKSLQKDSNSAVTAELTRNLLTTFFSNLDLEH